ncbi:MAG: hypothetical protein JNL60_04530 [Bacteroidia bacterium]|nr:hypothetical protein [Bacteroidia bacterium]
MKTSLLISLFLIYFAANANRSNPFKKIDSLDCLQIEGKILNNDDDLYGECVVDLIEANEIVQSVVLKEGKKQFKFILHKNSRYGIRIQKKGYINKIISIDTDMEGQSENFGLYRFMFETTLISEAVRKRMNEDIIDFPIAIIRFDHEEQTFSYDKKYTSYIKRELYNTSGNRSHKENHILPELAAVEN